MRARPATLIGLAILLAVATSTDGVRAQTSQSRTYRLTDQSTFSQGCFGLCLCPVLSSEPMEGTFRLLPAASSAGFATYKVLDLSWRVPRPDGDLRISGRGTYRIGGGFPTMHQLELALKLGEEPVQRFDSGLVEAGSKFPEIDIFVTVADTDCSRYGLRVSALPVPQAEVIPYALSETTYAEGCFGPCLCVITSRPVAGKFGLVKLRQAEGTTDFAVVGIKWVVGFSGTSDPATGFGVTGAGFYRVSSSPREESMTLDLSLDGKEPQSFESGTVPGGGNLRRIDLKLPANGFACFDQVFDLHARRSRFSSVLPSYRPQF